MKRMTVRALLVLLSVFVVAGCDLKGTVTTPDGAPLSGVTITAESINKSTVTDENGEYTLEVPNTVATYILTPSLDGYSFEPENLTVSVNRDTPSEGIGGLDFTGVASLRYEHVFDQGAGVPLVSQALINDRPNERTLSIYDFLAKPQTGDAVQMNAEGAVLVPEEGFGVLYLSHCPLNARYELSFAINYETYRDTEVGVYSRAQDCDPALIDSIYGNGGVAIENMYGPGFLKTGLAFESRLAVFYNNGYKYILGAAQEWNNTACKISVRQFDRYVRAEVYRDNALVLGSNILLPQALADRLTGTNIVPYLKKDIALTGVLFGDQLSPPFDPDEETEKTGDLYTEPAISFEYSHLFDEGPGLTPDQSLPETNTGDYSLEALFGSFKSVTDDYGLVNQASGDIEGILVSQSPLNVHDEMVFKFSGSSGGVGTVIKGAEGEPVLALGFGVINNEEIFFLVNFEEGLTTRFRQFNINGIPGRVYEWQSDSRLVVDVYGEKLQLKVYNNDALAGRLQCEIPEEFRVTGTQSGFFFMDTASVKQFRFAEITEAPFEGAGSGLLPMLEDDFSDPDAGDAVVYHDFSSGFTTALPGLPMNFVPPQQRNAGHLYYQWLSPDFLDLPYISGELADADMPMIETGNGVIGAEQTFAAVMFTEYDDCLIDLSFQMNETIDPDTTFCIAFRGGYGLYYIHKYKLVAAAFPGAYQYLYVFEDDDPFYTPNVTQKMGVRMFGDQLTVYINDVEVASLEAPLAPEVDNPNVHGFAGGLCTGLTIKSFAITPVSE